MKGKSDLGRMLLSVVIATMMVSIPANVFMKGQLIQNARAHPIPGHQNTIESSTMHFSGALTYQGNGVYIGSIPMTAGTYYIPGGPGTHYNSTSTQWETPDGRPANGGFDVYAREGGRAYVEGTGYYTIGSDHDAYNSSGLWGGWYDPDCADWDKYQLNLTENHWYLYYRPTWESPMSGTIYWRGDGTAYCVESDYGDPDTASYGGGPWTWDQHWSWGIEAIPLEYPGFNLTITDIGGGNYNVTMIPAPGPTKEITGGVEQTLTIGNTEVTINSSLDNKVIITEIANPAPNAPAPGNALVKPMEILVENESAVQWPIFIKVYYDLSDLPPGMGEGSLQGLAFYNSSSGAWELYNDTGVNTTDQAGHAGYVWARVWHLTPIAISGGSTPPTIWYFEVQPDTNVECGIGHVNASVTATEPVDGMAGATVTFNYSGEPVWPGYGPFRMDETDQVNHWFWDGYAAGITFNRTGTWWAMVNVTDNAGDWNTSWYSFTVVDTTPPTATPPQLVPGTNCVGKNWNFTTTVSDICCIDSVYLNISARNYGGHTSPISVPMNHLSGNVYYFESIYTLQCSDVGGYVNATVAVKDCSGNWYETRYTNVTFIEHAPTITNIREDSPSPLCYDGGYMNITADVYTDCGILNEVKINYTDASGAYHNVTMNYLSGDTYYYNITFSSCSDVGTWSYYIWADNTCGNSSSSHPSTFTVQDCILPEINNIVITNSTSMCYREAWVNISADVTDECGVAGVYLYYTPPGGPQQSVAMIHGSGDTYYYNLTGFTAHDVGTWTIDWIEADDINGNINSSRNGLYTFTLEDCYPPEIHLLQCYFKIEDGWDARICANVTDDVGVGDVVIYILYDSDYDGVGDTVVVDGEPMTHVSGDTYCYTYTAPIGVYGDYYYHVEANDTSGNRNSSVECYFEVVDEINDSTPPVIEDIHATTTNADSTCNGTVDISAKVTDDVGVGEVKVNITGVGSFDMTLSGPDTYTYHTQLPPGTYTYHIYAVDIVGNSHESPTYSFEIDDLIPPTIVDNSPSTGTTGDDYTFSADVTDNCCVNSVTVTWHHGSLGGTVVMNNVGGNTYEATVTLDDSLDDMTYTITAEDCHGNTASVDGVVTVTDNDDPQVIDITGDTTACTGDTVTITATLQDNIGIDHAYLYYRKATAATWLRVDFTSGSADIPISLYDDTDVYYYVEVFDTSLNAVTDPAGAPWDYYVIDVHDCIPPEINDVTDTPDPQIPGEDVQICATVTDNIGVDHVYVYIEEPADTDGYIFVQHEMTDMGGGLYCYNYTTDRTGEVRYYIEAVDTSGNTNESVYYTMEFKPRIDVDVTSLVKPEPGKWHNTGENEIWATVKNNGTIPIGDINLHLQIYEEITPNPEVVWYDDMESCYSNWTAEDHDHDGDTWAWTDVLSHSPTHSWHNSHCNATSYSGNADDWLISKEITIPECSSRVWLNFSSYVQGEVNPVYPGYNKLEDYLTVMVSVNNGPWTPVEMIVDTGGQWLYAEQAAFYAFVGYPLDKGLGIRLPVNGGDHIKIAFRWISDPAYNYMGAYIDDVKILTQCGSMQPLVYNEYKYLEHTLQPGEEVTVSFPMVKQLWHPKEDTTYFIEIYSDIGSQDIDGVGDMNGHWVWSDTWDTYYWLPLNGINESIHYGDVHDAMAIHVTSPDEVELSSCAESPVRVPINVTVYNNGTVTEDIPVKVAIREKVIKDIFYDDFESGTLDKWEGVRFTDDAADGFYWGISDWDPHTGNYHAFCGDARGFLHANMEQGLFTILNPDNTGFQLTGNEIRVMFTYWAQWKMNAEGHSNFELGTPIWSVDYDAWAPILEDPVQNAGLGTWPSAFLGYKVTGHSNDEYYGPEKPGPYVNPWDNGQPNPMGAVGSKYSESLFAIDMLPTMKHYADLGFTHYNFGWVVKTDESGMPDLTYPGDIWSGLKIDDVHIYAEYPGPVVWESEPQVVHLKPGESATLHFEWMADRFGDFVVDGFTALEGDINPDNDHAYNSTYVYTVAYEDNLEDHYKYDNWASEDNTIHTPSQYVSLVSNGKGGWQEDHYWYIGEGDGPYPSNADIILQMVNPDSDDGSFDISGADAATLEFNLWSESDIGWDYLTVEVSNDSGLDWYLLGVMPADWWFYWNTGDHWWHISIPLYNISSGMPFTVYSGYDPIFGYLGPLTLPTTDLNKLHFRFHFLTDESWVLEGVYIDDVFLNTSTNVTGPYDGHGDKNWEWVNKVVFHDDMEDAQASAEKWITYDGSPIGDLWHLSSYNPHSGTHKWWCGDEKTWSNYNKHLGPDILQTGMNGIYYDSSPMQYRNNMEDNLTLTLNLSNVYSAKLLYWENYTFADSGDYGVVLVSNDGGATWHEVGGTVGLTSNGWIQRTINLDLYLPGIILVRFEFISNETGTAHGWEIDDILVKGMQDCVAPHTVAILNPPEPDGCNGWYKSPVTITLVAQDNRELDSTYYSIDGGAWLKYTAPITINVDGEHTFSYYSVDSVGNVEDTHTISFKIDTTAPTVSFTYPQTGYIYLMGRQLFKNPFGGTFIIGKMTFQADASDATSGVKNVHFTIGNAEYDDTTSPYEVFWNNFDLLPHKYTATVTVTDNACNSGASDSLEFTHWL